MAKNEAGKPTVGFIVHTKVKRFVATRRKTKTLVRGAFLDSLESEVKRIVMQSAEAVDYPSHKTLDTIIVSVPKIKIKDCLVCHTRIKQCVHDFKPDMLVSKRFLADVNTHAAAMVISSLETITGVYLEQVASGNATAKIVDRQPKMAQQAIDAELPDLPKADDADKYTFEPALPREYITVTCQVQVQGMTLLVNDFIIFTGKTNEQIKKTMTVMATRALSLFGVRDPVEVIVLEIKRQKERFSGATK
ncbi:MAG: hypothetical protein WC052_04705 [Patescibacteria group bacterium]|jgi:hypothetical protein